MTPDGMTSVHERLVQPSQRQGPFIEQVALVEGPPADNAITGAYLAAEVHVIATEERMWMHHFEFRHLVERGARLFALTEIASPHVFTAMLHVVHHGGGYAFQGLIVPPAWRGCGQGARLIRRVVSKLESEGATGYAQAAVRLMPCGRLNEASIRSFSHASFVLLPAICTVAISPGDPTAQHILETAEPDGRSYRYVLMKRPLRPPALPTVEDLPAERG